MFNIFKKSTPVIASHKVPKQSPSTEVKLKLSGLHCSSCAVDIDLALEELPSVEATTSYAKSETKLTYDPKLTSLDKIKSIITELGYQIK